MTEKKFTKGDWNQEHCEIWIEDEYFGDVRTRDADNFIELLNSQHEEIEKLKKERDSLIQGIHDTAKMGADGIVQSMEKNFTLDTRYYKRRY